MDKWDHDAFRLYRDPHAATPRVGRSRHSSRNTAAEPQTARVQSSAWQALGKLLPRSKGSKSGQSSSSRTPAPDHTNFSENYAHGSAAEDVPTSIYGGFNDDDSSFGYNPHGGAYGGVVRSRSPSPSISQVYGHPAHEEVTSASQYPEYSQYPQYAYQDDQYGTQGQHYSDYDQQNTSFYTGGADPVDDTPQYSRDGDLSSIIQGYHFGSGSSSAHNDNDSIGNFEFGNLNLYGSSSQSHHDGAYGTLPQHQVPQTFHQEYQNHQGYAYAPQQQDPAAITEDEDTGTGKKEKKKGKFSICNKHEKARIVDYLHIVTGLIPESIAIRCRKDFTPELKTALLSGDAAKMEQARNTLFPATYTSRYASHTPKQQTWMRNMSIEQSKVVVWKMSQVVHRDEVHVRNFFLNTQLEEDIAWAIYNTPVEDCAQFVYPLGLDNIQDRMISDGRRQIVTKVIDVWPWMRELEGKYFNTVIAKLASAAGINEYTASQLLRSPRVESLLGRRILQASPSEMKRIALELKS
ncbi:hypothetical protein CBS101457_000146 [Exobasidium rhododendri]|nr:hypothetical protein CBS101457_000146 [Exobasidium rhododendri]